MERDRKRLTARREFIVKVVNNSDKPVTETVSVLAEKLFLSERTIWNDITIYCKDGINMPNFDDR